jgi:hypothetical protein
LAELDEIIHQPLRLKIMAALNALPAGTGLEFVRLKKLTVDKAFVGKKPQTTVTAAASGRAAFARHVAGLQEIIAGAAAKPAEP